VSKRANSVDTRSASGHSLKSEVVEKIVMRFRKWHSLGRAGVHRTASARYSRNLSLEFRIRQYQPVRDICRRSPLRNVPTSSIDW